MPQMLRAKLDGQLSFLQAVAGPQEGSGERKGFCPLKAGESKSLPTSSNQSLGPRGWCPGGCGRPNMAQMAPPRDRIEHTQEPQTWPEVAVIPSAVNQA